MGNLTDDMTRLRGEVDALRGARSELINKLTLAAKDLTATVADMRVNFLSTHAAMAKQAQVARQTFVTAISDDVSSLLANYAQNRHDMARKGIQERLAFLSEMKSQVKSMCKNTANDLIGAGLAWRGQSRGGLEATQFKKETAVAEPDLLPVEKKLKEMASVSDFKTEETPVTFTEPLQERTVRTDVATHQPYSTAIKTKQKTPEGPAFQEGLKSSSDNQPKKAENKAKRGRKNFK